MRKLAWHSSFRQSFKRITRRDEKLKEQIFQVLNKLMIDPFQPALKTHKLSGQLHGLWACWVDYDCRIVFTFEVDSKTNEELIVLIDLGTHDEVY